MGNVIRNTRSVCPICLKNIPAELNRQIDGSVYLEKQCPDHGNFSVPVWRGALDYDDWILGAEPLENSLGENCPERCGLCPEHEVDSCCVLLEVTRRCNLHCRFCFANGGSVSAEPSLEELKNSIQRIVKQCGSVLLQLSGGEPTLRDDLPELIQYAKKAGCSYVQINTNGIRLAEDPEYANRLAEAGLDIVFLQFDGTKDAIYTELRGKPLLATKLKAIKVCDQQKIGVTLVPTIVKGVNTDNLGEIIRLAISLSPGVRGVHFQPVSYFGRYPAQPQEKDRYTLDQLMVDICDQTRIPISSFLPSRCDHPLCGFHADFLIDAEEKLKPLSSITHASRNQGYATENREYVARHWCREKNETDLVPDLANEMDFDTFLYLLRHRRLMLSAMAFQDAMNLNIERLHRCSLHVYDHGLIKPFCSEYLSAFLDTY